MKVLFLKFLQSFVFVIWCMSLTHTLGMAKEFTLVRWVEDDTVGIMPLTAVVAGTNCTSMPCVGAVVDM